jgi:N6-L-threonylcarbamoyladenine synthase
MMQQEKLWTKLGNPNAYHFPEPQIPGLDFSFSGLKTAFLYFVRDKTAANQDFLKNNLPDICASIEKRIASILINKLKKAAQQYQITEIALAGGVSANTGLRNLLQQTANENGWNCYVPAFEYCTDNAAMIAATGYYKFLEQDFVGQDIAPLARMQF